MIGGARLRRSSLFESVLTCNTRNQERKKGLKPQTLSWVAITTIIIAVVIVSGIVIVFIVSVIVSI